MSPKKRTGGNSRKGSAVSIQPRRVLIRDHMREEWQAMRDGQWELETSRQLLADLYDQAPVGYLTLDRNGCISAANLTGAQMLGRPRRHLIGRPLWPMIGASDRRNFLRHLSRLRGGQNSARTEVELAGRPGHSRTVQLVSSLVESSFDPAIRFHTAMVDISERVRADHELREAHRTLEARVAERTTELSAANERLKALVDGSPLAILTVDRAGNVTSWNRSAERMFGWTEQEVLGRSPRHVPEDKREEFLRAHNDALAGKSIVEMETRRRRKDGSRIDVALSNAPLRDGEGRIVGSLGIHADITERKRLQEAVLAVSETERQRIGRDLHDGLSQLLAGIGFKTDALRARLQRQYPKIAREIRTIGGHIKDARELTHSLSHGLCPIHLSADGMAAALRALAGDVEKVFGVPCRSVCDEMVRIDEDFVARQVYRIAQEATHNAAKHSKAKLIRIELRRAGPRITLAVEDDGIGFDPSRAKARSMGLNIMRYRAQQIGAELDIKSASGHGTTVVCALKQKGDLSQES